MAMVLSIATFIDPIFGYVGTSTSMTGIGYCFLYHSLDYTTTYLFTTTIFRLQIGDADDP